MLKKAKVKKVLMITEMLVAAHKYFKINEGESSVSLRDVSRFIILFEWFKRSLQAKQNFTKFESYHKN